MDNGNEKLDIVSLPVSLDMEMFDSRFRLVVVAAETARRMIKDKNFPKGKKVSTQAIEDALTGRTKFLIGDKAVKAFAAKEKAASKEPKPSLIFNSNDEIAKEVRKDLDSYLTGNAKVEKEPVAKPKLSSVDEVDEVEK